MTENNIENTFISNIDVTPPTSIYEIFRNLTYSFDSALAEFIDNSTQSFKDNKTNSKDATARPKIYIVYYSHKNNEKIQILDNCFGIKNENLERVLKLNIKPKNKFNSRNEYGMGLKTAAFWFGNNISVVSKYFLENKTSVIDMSLQNLEKNVPINYQNSEYFKKKYIFDFGSVIEISNLFNDKKIKDNKLIHLGKIFSSKYRQDIENDNLEIYLIKVNDNGKIFFVENDKLTQIQKVLDSKPIKFYLHKYKIDLKSNKELKIKIDTSFCFEDENFFINGVIGILDNGSRNIAGLTLFRRGRSIIGDEDGKKYKPWKIFKDPASFEYQRIYGYLNLDDFPVYQAKNGFKWDNGLEDALIDCLHKNITQNDEQLNLINIAKKIRNKNFSFELSSIKNEETAIDIKDSISSDCSFKEVDCKYSEESKNFYIKLVNNLGEEVIFDLNIIKNVNDEKFNWITIEENASLRDLKKYLITLNLDIPFFEPFNNDKENVKYQMIKFCIYFAYSEIIHGKLCKKSDHQRTILNDVFSENIKSEDGKI